MPAVGRPLKFKSVEELETKINEYFNKCDKNTKQFVTKDGELIEVPDPIPYTISGLAYHLDTSRRTLIDYEERDDEYSHTIRKAKDRCEAFAEESLWKPKIATGIMFNLQNNYGWRQKQELDANLSGGLDNTNVNVKMSKEEMLEYLKNK